jgi:hypothetical protein
VPEVSVSWKLPWLSAGQRWLIAITLSTKNAPAPDMLWSYRRRSPTDLNIVKAARAAMLWRDADRAEGLRIVASCLAWLCRLPRRAVVALMESGKATRNRYGRSLLGQLNDMLRVALVNGLTPKEYYRAALARHGGGDQILGYAPFNLVGTVALHLSVGTDFAEAVSLSDKTDFERRCRAAGLPVARTIAIARGTEVRAPTGAIFQSPWPECDLIIKPEIGAKGLGIEGWRPDRRGRFSSPAAGAESLTRQELVKRVLRLAEEYGVAMLIQERLENHADLHEIAGSALATTRIVTMFNEAGDPEIVDSFYRTSILPNVPVDNFHNRGILFPIDIATGTLHPGLADGNFDPDLTVRHPQTGAAVAGRVHPGWPEMTDLALRLHRLYPDCVMPGWDIAFSPRGAVALEVNVPPGFSINRQPTLGGLVGTRTFQLLAFHAARWLDSNEPRTSRWRPRRVAPPRSDAAAEKAATHL